MVSESTLESIWSNTDYPYLCLVDRRRTLGFKAAIDSVVRSGDTVVEVGAGTGILSLFAAAAGAAKVLAVEIDPVLARTLKETVAANDLASIVEVVEGDALTVDLPRHVDVVVGELIETGLLDEMQVAVTNRLWADEVIGPHTQVVPQTYRTRVQLATTDNSYFGFVICAPKHEWPYYAADRTQWESLRTTPVTPQAEVAFVDFGAGPVDPEVDVRLPFRIEEGASANAVILSGVAGLTSTLELGACNSFSGDKILALPRCHGEVELHIRYVMGSGLDRMSVDVV